MPRTRPIRASHRPCWWCRVTPRNRLAPRANPELDRLSCATSADADMDSISSISPWYVAQGKFRCACAPQYLIAALSYARAASDSVE